MKTFYPDINKPLEEERKANASKVAARAAVGFFFFSIFACAGFIGLEHYLEAVRWSPPEGLYQVVEEGNMVRFQAADYAPVSFANTPADGVTRILVVGDSAAMGFPERPRAEADLPQRYGIVGALQGSLDSATGGAVELVNLSVAGGTSADAARILRRATGWGARAVIVHTGHDEFVGLPDNFNSDIWGSLLYRMAATASPRPRPRPSGWVEDPWYDNERNYAAVVSEFRSNLRVIKSVSEDAGLQVIAVKPAVNLSGVDPNWSTSGADFDMRALWTWNNQTLEGVHQTRTDIAELNWALGKRREQDGLDPHRPLLDAVDADGLPMRVTAPLRGVIDEVAREGGWAVADAQAAVKPASGAAGDAAFYDHVHPRPQAAAAIAAAIGAAMAEAGILTTGPEVEPLLMSSAESADAALVAAERWVVLACLRDYDPGFRLGQAQVWTDRALALRPDDPYGLAMAALLARMRGDELPPALSRDAAVRERMEALHPSVRRLIDGE